MLIMPVKTLKKQSNYQWVLHYSLLIGEPKVSLTQLGIKVNVVHAGHSQQLVPSNLVLLLQEKDFIAYLNKS
jgi:hypothetical protein